MQPEANADAIEVHLVSLDASAAEIARLLPILAPDERARAGRASELGRRTFVPTRAALRVALGAALGAAPAAVALAYAPHGKPVLARGGPPHVSVAHAGGRAAIALAPRPVGIDLEPVRPVPERDALAARFFHPAELAELRSLPAGERDLAFLRCWTRKEAYAKATGDGMALALARCRVSSRAGDARVVAIDGDPAAGAAWTLHDVALAPGFVCTLAYRGAALPVRVVGAATCPCRPDPRRPAAAPT